MIHSITTRRDSPTSGREPSEEGYILVAVIFMLALMVIALTVAAPKIAKSIQREREIETMHRGKQYARAVKLYYKQFNAYPPNVDALVKTNEIRFLRKKYIDPTTGKDEWKVVHFGQQKTQTLGFFGQPIGGAVGGAGLSGANGLAGANGLSGGSAIGGIGSTSAVGTGSFGSGSFGSSTGSSTGSTIGGSTGGTDQSGGTTSINGDQTGGSATAGSGTDAGTPGGAAGTGSNPTTSSFGSQIGGQTFGGGGIMGFSPNSPKQSILVYKKKNHYNEWEFLYDPIADQMMMQGGGNLGAIGTPIGGSNGGSTVGGGTGGGVGSGIGPGSTTGGTPTVPGGGTDPGGTDPGGTTPTSPSTPQQ